MKKIFFIYILLISINSIAQYKKNDFFGKWKIINIDSKILENDTQKTTIEKVALKQLISSKFEDGDFYIELSKNNICFFEKNEKTEKYKVKSMKLIDNKLEIVFDKYKKTFILRNNDEGELSGDGVTHYLKKG